MTKRSSLVAVANVCILMLVVAVTTSHASGRLAQQSSAPPLGDPAESPKANLSGSLPISTHTIYLPHIASLPRFGWEAIGPSEAEAVRDIDVALDDSLRLYVSTNTGIYRSTNRGLTWRLALGGFFQQLVIDPQQPNILYTGPRDDQGRYGVFKSTDGGSSWTHHSKGMTCRNPAGLTISATEPNTLFTGSY